MLRAKLKATGMYVPEKVVTNRDLEKLMDTSDEWIQQRSGIKERRWIEPGKDTTCSMAVNSCRQALQAAQVEVDEVDMIIFGCLVSDYVFPGTGVLLQRELGFKKPIPALDIRNQCSGFLYGLSVADAWIQTGKYKKILLVGSEIHSTTLDKTTRGRNVSVLFGDGAGAALIEATEQTDIGVIDTVLHSEGRFAEALAITKPSSNDSPRVFEEQGLGADIYAYMDGKLVFKNAVTRMTEAVGEVCENSGKSLQDIDFVVAHQANARINQMVLQNLKLPDSKTHNTLQKYGNTTMATIPITLHEAFQEGKVKPGDLLALVAFGSGFVWGASLVQL